MKEGIRLANLLREIARVVEQLDDDELLNFFSTFQRTPSVARQRSGKTHGERSRIDAAVFIKELEAASSRAEGENILERNRLSRSELANLARLRDIHVRKEDTVARIKEKLVEALIGSRLGSMAIRGE